MNMNQGDYQNYQDKPQTDAEKSQAGTNLVIIILVLVIVVAGVKLLISSNSAIAPASETTATSTASVVDAVDAAAPIANEASSATEGAAEVTMPIGKGEVAFSVLAKEAVVVRAIFVYNPARASEGDVAWIQVYDGYKAVPAGQSTLVFTVSLAAMQYDEVRVRTLNVATGIPDEVVKAMPIAVSATEKSLVTIEL